MSELIEKPAHYYNAPRKEMLSYIPLDARRILDVGCGEGRFGYELKRTRAVAGLVPVVVGIELESERAEIAREYIDQVITANIEYEDLGLPEHSFDCIVCNDVIEHLVSPWKALGVLRSLLAPGGILIASIPNVRFWGVLKGLLIDADWKYADEGVLDTTHLRFFTRTSIKRLFEDTGFEIVRIEGINSQVSGWKYNLLCISSGGRLEDIRFLQFAIVAKCVDAS